MIISKQRLLKKNCNSNNKGIFHFVLQVGDQKSDPDQAKTFKSEICDCDEGAKRTFNFSKKKNKERGVSVQAKTFLNCEICDCDEEDKHKFNFLKEEE